MARVQYIMSPQVTPNLLRKMGKRIKYYKKPKPLSTTSFEPLSTTTKGGYTTNV